MKIVVTGGREFDDLGFIGQVLEKLSTNLKDPIWLCHGGARGADQGCGVVGQRLGFSIIQQPALWGDLSQRPCKTAYRRDGTAYNRLAGFNRNQAMIDDFVPDVGLIFPGGAGTQDMANRLQIAEIVIGTKIYDFRPTYPSISPIIA